MSAIEWTSHPARRRPDRLMLAICVALLTAWAVLEGLRSLPLAGLAVVVLAIAVAPFWLPTRYRLDDDAVELRRFGRAQRRRWAELRRVEIGREAILVSPLARRSVLDGSRGLVLLLDGAPRDAVVELVRAKMPGVAS